MTDLINGRTPEEIKAALKHCIEPVPYGCEVCPYNETCLEHAPEIDAIALIERLESERDEALAKVPKWISVEERMPEACQPVIVHVRHTEEWRNTVLTEHPWHVVEEDIWLGDGWCNNADVDIHEVTHWMPMPEPPDGGKSNEDD